MNLTKHKNVPKYPTGGYSTTNPYANTTYGPNIAQTPLDVEWSKYYSKASYDQYQNIKNTYDDALASYYDETNAAVKAGREQSMMATGLKTGSKLRGGMDKYKESFQMQTTSGAPVGTGTSASTQMSYSPEMIAEMKAAGTLPKDIVIADAKAPWSIAGQKAATWSMGTGVGKAGTAIAPYAPFAYIAGKGLEMWADDKKPETYTFKEGAAGFVSGAASGAMIGSMILPGIGTVAGALIGGIASIFTGKSKAKKYKNYLKELDAYNKKKDAYEEYSQQYRHATSLQGSQPIMKRYWKTGGFTDYKTIPVYA